MELLKAIANPLWHFSKTKSNFNQQILCLKFVSRFLSDIEKESCHSPVAEVLSLPTKLESYQTSIDFPEIQFKTDGSLGLEVSTEFIKIYQVSFDFPSLS